ncbi:MAG: anti-sigma factor [Actinomycetota bacterium]|nr:anti-sigma factor [Actinomycetota bacterium]
MTDPMDTPLLELASAYALDAVSDSEREDIERRVAAAPSSEAEEFYAEVRAVWEAMAALSDTTRLEPSPALRAKILNEVALPASPRRTYWRAAVLAAAAAIIAAVVATGITVALRPAPPSSTTEHVLAAPDLRTATAQLPGGGTVTMLSSQHSNAAVIVMNNVPPPHSGSVYEMWLIDPKGPRPAGTMDTDTVKPSTTAVIGDLGHSTVFALTKEPGRGSSQPTTSPLLTLPLT